jgi:hypothetical protein
MCHNPRMRRESIWVLRGALFSVLGLVPLACTGQLSVENVGPSACDQPQDIGSGLLQCSNGSVHRAKVEGCTSSLPRPDVAFPPPEMPAPNSCSTDADCSAQSNGYCDPNSLVGGAHCVYGCLTDADCGAEALCRCGTPVGLCVPAGCRSDADCSSGFRCQASANGGGAFECQTAQDTCSGSNDCAGTGLDVCDWMGDHFACGRAVANGRPFLVDGYSRVAPLAKRQDWPASIELRLGMTAPVRAIAAESWARVGQLEHASVAAFARFALQLLALGAPPELIEQTTQAIADETRHARLAFGVASVLADKALGPAALDVERCLLETSLVDVVRVVVREGCIGETAAALAAREAARGSADRALAELLDAIADDETRHAELAWRFVSWALERSPSEVAAVLRSEIERAERDQAPLPPRPSADELAAQAFGVLPARTQKELQNAAFREVIAPCAAAVLAQSASGSPENPVLSA